MKKFLYLSFLLYPFFFGCTSSEDGICYSFDLRQCNLDPWSMIDNTMSVEESIQAYLLSEQISVIKISSEITMEVVCLACSCPSGEQITVTINEEDADKIEQLDLLNLSSTGCE